MSFLSEPTIIIIALAVATAVYIYAMAHASVKPKQQSQFLPPPPPETRSPREQPAPNSIYRRLLHLPPPQPIEKKLKEAKASQRKQTEQVKELEARVGELNWAIKLRPDLPTPKPNKNHISSIKKVEEKNDTRLQSEGIDPERFQEYDQHRATLNDEVLERMDKSMKPKGEKRKEKEDDNWMKEEEKKE